MVTRAMGTYGDVHSTDRTSVATPDLYIRRPVGPLAECR